MFSKQILSISAEVLQYAAKSKLRIGTAESCTCGLIAASLGAIAGASRVLEKAFVVYSVEAKKEILAVPEKLIEQYGTVSQQVADAMVRGIFRYNAIDFAIATTGNAGPATDNNNEQIGLVHFAFMFVNEKPLHVEKVFQCCDRNLIQLQSVVFALQFAKEILQKR